MSRSQTITNPDWLHNAHAGEMLVGEFLDPLDMDASALAKAIDVPANRIEAVIDGSAPMDAELDLRLGRYFRMSEKDSSSASRTVTNCLRPSVRSTASSIELHHAQHSYCEFGGRPATARQIERRQARDAQRPVRQAIPI